MNKAQSSLGIQILLVLLFSGLFYFFSADQALLESLLFFVGSCLGVALLYLDEQYFSSRYAAEGVEHGVVITRSILFVLTLVPLGIFLLTSSGSALGFGLFMMILTGIFVEMVLIRKDTTRFHLRFLSQLKKPWNQQQVLTYISGLGFFWLYLLVLLFIL